MLKPDNSEIRCWAACDPRAAMMASVFTARSTECWTVRASKAIEVQTIARATQPLPAHDESESVYVRLQSFECVACTRVHLVNLKTGEVLGEDED